MYGWPSNLLRPLICSVCWVWQQCDRHDKLDVHLRLDHLRKDKQHLDQADPLWSQLQVRISNIYPFFLCALILANLSQGSNWLRAILHGDLQPDLFLQLRPDARQHGLQQLPPHGGESHFSLRSPLWTSQEGYCGVTYREVSGTTPDAFNLLPNPSPGTVVTCPASFINIPKLRWTTITYLYLAVLQCSADTSDNIVMME